MTLPKPYYTASPGEYEPLKEFPSLWEIRQTGLLDGLELCATWDENGWKVEDKVNLVDELERRFSVRITDEEFAWATTPVKLIAVIDVLFSEAQAS